MTVTQARRLHVANFTLSLAFILVLGVIDYQTGDEFDLFLFYAIPVALIAWWVGRWAAVSLALVSVGVWFAANPLEAIRYSSPFFLHWNAILHAGWLLLVVFTISQIRSNFDRERRLNADLAQALSQVRELRGLLPLCAWCRKIRNDEGYWEQIESYLRRTTHAEFTHGICPDCAVRLRKEATAPQGDP